MPTFPLTNKNASFSAVCHDNKNTTYIKKIYISWDRDKRTERASGKLWLNCFRLALTFRVVALNQVEHIDFK